MTHILKIFFLIFPILITGCTSGIAEKVSEENNTAIKYENSDTRLNQHYQSLYNISPSMLTSDIEENQVKWLKSRDKACNTLNLRHPNSTEDMECFIKENSERADQGTHYTSKKFSESVTACDGMTQSMSRKGNCWDNTPTERFFKK